MPVSSDDESTPTTAEIDAISSRRFSNSFRGWNPDEVRVHLVEVAEIVRSLTHRQGELERLLAEAEAAARRADLTRLDPDEVARVLGEETARVLRTARESAAEIEAKAGAQAELLARQAADDAAATRAAAAEAAEQIRAEAEETAAATRAAGEAHLADVRAAGEAELAQLRERLEAEIGEERRQMSEEGAALAARAQDDAAEVRRVADADAARVRAEAEEYAADSRREVDTELAQRRAVTEQEVTILSDRAAAQVAEAERMRDRILADLARKRRAARQHLEQLHAGRDRLLTAYEVIRATTDEATGELSVVLPDAKRAADDAARRIGGESLPTPEEMLAELELAKIADLPVVAPTSEGAGDETGAGSDPEGSIAPDAEVGPPVVDEADGRDDEAGTDAGGDAGKSTGPGDVTGTTAGTVAGTVDGATEDPAVSGEVASSPVDEPAAADPPAVPRTNHRRQGRRGKHRHDPLGGESLPDVPMTPVDASAEFESVRVVTAASPSDTADSEPAGSAGAAPTGEDPGRAGFAPTGEPDAASVSGAAPADATGSARAADEPVRTAVVPSVESGPPPDAAGTGEPDDAVSGIFARLRAERETPADDVPADPSGRPATSDPTAHEVVAATPGATTAPVTAAKQGSAPTAKPKPASKPKPKAAAQPAPTAKAEPVAKPGATAKSKSTKAGGPGPTAGPGPTPRPETKKAAASKPKGAARDYDDATLASLFERRDAAVDEVARRLAKHLKRQLSDQQSALLDELRQHRGVADADAVLGDSEAFAADWHRVITDDLAGAVAAGAAFVGDLRNDAVEHVDVDLTAATAHLVESIAVPLRSRLARALGEGIAAGDDEAVPADDPELADRIRACYREWRGARLATAAADACAGAFGSGVRAAVPRTVGLRWFCGPGDAPCSDCNDNQLAGTVAADAVFPTGQPVAPAHPGCRCLALPERTG